MAASKTLRCAGFLAFGIGLPAPEVKGDMNGLRFGTPELVRWGMTSQDNDRLSALITSGLEGADIAAEVAEWRQSFQNCILCTDGTLGAVHGAFVTLA
ncbi:hypothetical protein [Ruegeria sp. AU67]|uniref:hypothetical protein n=1 Tax=Ruegeria sp. AU67 TaxID=2108530 RepID=UPI00351677A5